MDIAEDQGKVFSLLKKWKFLILNYGVAMDADTALDVARSIGYPVLVRPSYVLGGQRNENC